MYAAKLTVLFLEPRDTTVSTVIALVCPHLTVEDSLVGKAFLNLVLATGSVCLCDICLKKILYTFMHSKHILGKRTPVLLGRNP